MIHHQPLAVSGPGLGRVEIHAQSCTLKEMNKMLADPPASRWRVIERDTDRDNS